MLHSKYTIWKYILDVWCYPLYWGGPWWYVLIVLKSENIQISLYTIISNTLAIELKTAIWYQKKEKLNNGPTFPNGFLKNHMFVYELCSATLNRSHVMLVGYSTGYSRIRRVVIYDYVEELWYFLSDLELEVEGFEEFFNCRGSVAIDKSGKK